MQQPECVSRHQEAPLDAESRQEDPSHPADPLRDPDRSHREGSRPRSTEIAVGKSGLPGPDADLRVPQPVADAARRAQGRCPLPGRRPPSPRTRGRGPGRRPAAERRRYPRAPAQPGLDRRHRPLRDATAHPGGGSSRVAPTRVDVAADEIRAVVGATETCVVAGYRHVGDAQDDGDDERLRAEAVRSASRSDAAVVFLGLTDAEEAEGTDRTHIDLPDRQLALLEAVAAVQPRTVAVVVHGGVVRLREVADLVPAMLDAPLLGQAGWGAVADVLFGWSTRPGVRRRQCRCALRTSRRSPPTPETSSTSATARASSSATAATTT
ncbi:glycoside hydrolase family 3 C-terminal domain-containing protein [Streptomyces sp. NPDC005373]|uniref:glycoside hydrolase family 3 protein n=1 Tax=Streptomyces sp. NPDC005373 TaxID=3156879 RepID=UPI0033BE7F1E